jgi:hypothetical protein
LKERYTSTRPKVERKIGHMARTAWGGRKARCRGVARSFTDVLTRAAAVNCSRLAVLGVHRDGPTWAVRAGPRRRSIVQHPCPPGPPLLPFAPKRGEEPYEQGERT